MQKKRSFQKKGEQLLPSGPVERGGGVHTSPDVKSDRRSAGGGRRLQRLRQSFRKDHCPVDAEVAPEPVGSSANRGKTQS